MSGNAYSLAPELPTPFPNVPELWVCPKTGLKIPKNPTKNLQWRARLLSEAEQDPGLQSDLYSAASESLLFWVNAFAFTFRVQDTDSAGKRRQASQSHIPYVTWEIQDRHMTEIENAINSGYDLLSDKTRDMGSTWDHVAVLHHQWLFRENRLFLEMSRVETDVDGADNPRCLFAKHDYINNWLPEWMRPEINRTRMHIVNVGNGSRIDGESSNKAAGSGDRRNAILLDEFAKMENAESIKSATADVTPCRLPNSTPFGPGTAYSKWAQSGQIKVFRMPWYEHPEKGLNRYVKQCDITGKWMIRSPWYDAESQKRTPKEMAQEIDMDHIGSGDTFFESHIIEAHRTLYARPCVCRMAIDFREGIANDAIPDMLVRRQLDALHTRKKPSGPLRIWTNLIGGRLDQTKTYSLGIDISKGQGASNSVISILCRETGEKVGEWADANTPPYDFARIACAVAMWVGGASGGGRPIMVWESNGDPGIDFGREITKKFRYPFCFMDRTIGTTSDKQTKRFGWHSNPDKKAHVLGAYRQALAHGGVINHSSEALDEALTYIVFDGGGIGPAELLAESSTARAAHGDRVIADALAVLGFGDTPRAKTKDPVPPGRSFGGRKVLADKKKREEKQLKRFDFRQ